MLDPRQIGEGNEPAEFIAARYKNENDAGNRQGNAGSNDALATLEVTYDRFVSRSHGLSLLRAGSTEQGRHLAGSSEERTCPLNFATYAGKSAAMARLRIREFNSPPKADAAPPARPPDRADDSPHSWRSRQGLPAQKPRLVH
jgi:hypothetical protein